MLPDLLALSNQLVAICNSGLPSPIAAVSFDLDADARSIPAAGIVRIRPVTLEPATITRTQTLWRANYRIDYATQVSLKTPVETFASIGTVYGIYNALVDGPQIPGYEISNVTIGDDIGGIYNPETLARKVFLGGISLDITQTKTPQQG